MTALILLAGYPIFLATQLALDALAGWPLAQALGKDKP
jgi:hypothetical protein